MAWRLKSLFRRVHGPRGRSVGILAAPLLLTIGADRAQADARPIALHQIRASPRQPESARFLVGGANVHSLGLLPSFTTARLSNGMRVILAPNPRTTHVHVTLTHALGAEDGPRRGAWHLFMRLAFNFVGTQAMPISEIDRAMNEDGVTVNWEQNEDSLALHVRGPSSHLGYAIWQASEPLASLFDGMSSAAYENARKSLAIELAARGDNADALAATVARLRPVGHAYHQASPATGEEIAALSLEQARTIHRACMVPNSAALVVAGNFESRHASELIEKYFGPIPSSGVDAPCRKPRDTKTSSTAAELLFETGARDALVELAWATPPFRHPDDLALDVAASAIRARLHALLIGNLKIAKQVFAWQASARAGSIFRVRAIVTESSTAAAVKRAIEAEMARIARDGFTRDEFDRARRARIANTTNLDDPELLARRLSFASIEDDGAAWVTKVPEAFATLEASAVETAVRTHLGPERRVGLAVERKPGAPVRARFVGEQK